MGNLILGKKNNRRNDATAVRYERAASLVGLLIALAEGVTHENLCRMRS
jgi:hypothetical protein